MSQSRVQELSEMAGKTYFTGTFAEYERSYMNGEAEGLCSVEDFVGNQKQIDAEIERRYQLANKAYSKDRGEFSKTVYQPITAEINKLTMDLVPEELKPAADKIYSMAYERSHSAGYFEVYTTMSDLVNDIVEVVNLCKGEK